MRKPRPKNAKSETRLAETETRNNILEVLPIGICQLDLKGTVEYVNKYFEEVTGYPRDEIVGSNLLKLKLLPDNMRSYILKRIAARIAGAPSKKWDTQFKCKDGTWIWVNLEGRIIWKSGVPVGFQIVASNITERKRMEKALRESEQRYQTLSEVSPVGIFRTDLQGSTTYVNKRWCEISGLSAEESLGDGWLKAVHPDDREKLSHDWQNTVQTQSDSRRDYRFLKPDGSIIWVIGQAVPEKDKSGQILSYVGTITDITERKQSEEKVNHLAAIVQSSGDAIIGKSLDGIITSWNKGAEKLYGYTESEVLGKSILLLYPPGNEDEMPKIINRIKSGEYIDKYETVRRRKDGQVIQISLAVSPILSSEGKIIAASTIGRDITKQKEILAALRVSAGQSKGLKDLIPICAGCNKIRDDEKEGKPWVSPAEYLSVRLPDVHFTHGMCPDCMQKWYPDYDSETDKLSDKK